MLSTSDLTTGVRFGLLVAYILGMAPIIRRVWRTRRIKTSAKRLRLERLEVNAIMAFFITMFAGIGFAWSGLLKLGAGLAIAGVISAVIGVSAHLARVASDE